MTFIILAVIALVVVFVILSYNALIRRRNQVDNAWSQVDVQLKRRLDLIPNLVETVKGYAEHERATLEAVINARNAAMAAGPGPVAQGQADNALTGALRQLFALSEAYPDLKAKVVLPTPDSSITIQFSNTTTNLIRSQLCSLPRWAISHIANSSKPKMQLALLLQLSSNTRVSTDCF